MLDTRRIEIAFFPGFEVDARCRVFETGSYVPLPCEWPYVTLGSADIRFSLKAPELCALAFLGTEGCEAVFRELFAQEVFKGHPRIKEIALEKGISQWAVIEAARRHHSRFRVSSILSDLRAGKFGPTMWVHRISAGIVDRYEVYEERSGAVGSPSLFDHALAVGAKTYRFRTRSPVPMASRLDAVDFSYRIDPEGGRFIVLSSFQRVGKP